MLLYYLCVINIITLGVFAWDKYAATKGMWRVREATLFALSIAGGSLGAWIAMYTCRHKTRKPAFFIGVPVILFLQMAGLALVMK